MYDITDAVSQNDLAQIRDLATFDEGVNTLDPSGLSVLMFATLEPECRAETVELLLRLGADPNYQDSGPKFCALHFAARDGKAEFVSALLRNGAKIDLLDSFGNTPLWHGVMGTREDTSIIRLLLDAGSDPEIENAHGVSPLALAQRAGKESVVDMMQSSIG